MQNKHTLTTAFPILGIVMLLGLVILFMGCKSDSQKDEPEANTQTEAEETIWHIKAIHPRGRTLDIKALDKDGNIYNVIAIERSGQRYVMDIKAFIQGKRLPVKVMMGGEPYSPVKAIGEDGTIYDIKALTPEGEKLDVKGVSRSGNIIHIKAIDKTEAFYGVKAISPEGQLNDVKGVKMVAGDVETQVNGVDIHAHVKALPQAGGSGGGPFWYIKAIHPEGGILDIKALDAKGTCKSDVNAIEEYGQRHLMDIKAFVGEKKLPVKILVSSDKYAPVKAIGEDGATYAIKAFTSKGDKLDVKGVSRLGNIIAIKAIDEAGVFYGIKAISPAGQMNDVKGVKMSEEDLELIIKGYEVHAHIKALPQLN